MGKERTKPSRALQLGLQLHQRGWLDQAESHYRAVLAAQPRNFDAMHLLGLLRFQQGRHVEALDHMSAALRLRPGAAAALSNLGLVLGALGRLEEALARFDKALQIKPDFAEALNNRGNALLHLARFEEALASFDKALAINPDNAEALNNRGKTLLGLKRPVEALASFDRALEIRPDFAEALNNRGIALADLKRPEEALASFDRALALKPDQAEVLYNRGNRLLELDRPEEALASFDRALALKPDFAEALYNRGDTLLKLNRPEEALASLDRALAVRPDYAEAHNNRGRVLLLLLRPGEALASFDKALAITPDDAEVLYNRGKTLLDLGWAAEAVESVDKALAINPNDAKALNCRGIALVDLKRPEEGLASFDRALEIEPDDTDLISAQLNAALQACRWTRVNEIADRLLSRKTWREGPLIPFPMLVCCDDPSVHLDCARHLIQGGDSSPAPRWNGPPRPRDKLRVAYISADFRVHPVAALMCELFELHDRARFEIFAIATGVDDRSQMRSRLVKTFDRFLDVRYQDDEAVAQLLKDLQTDIAVDLTGYTRDGRIGVLALRPAPVQAIYLGYPGTTGADFIDYVIADATVLPFDQQPYYAERIVHLPDTYQVNSRRPIPSDTPTRQACRLPENAFVFCCFNYNYKITQEIFDVWMRLLAAKPGSVLWLARDNADSERNLRQAAHEAGVDGTRLVFAERVPQYQDHLARHRQADLFLDTLPYNAHTTASDALWVGLPLVTCTGRSYAARAAASVLRAAGLPELVTHSLADYESLAMTLAANPALLKGYRQRLEENRDTCVLFDTARFARHIEAAYIKMWEIHERGEGPQSFSVSA